MWFNLKGIKQLVELVSTRNIEALEINALRGLLKVRISKNHRSPALVMQNRLLPDAFQEPETENNLEVIKSPMVGIFYRGPKPGAKPYVEVGDKIEVGQIVCVILALKIFNEIEAKQSGIIRKILKEDKDVVEFGSEMFLVEPTE